MYGSINLGDPRDHHFVAESSNDRLHDALDRAFRPQTLEKDNFRVHLLGSLVGVRRKGALQPCTLVQLHEHYQSSSLSDFIESLEGLFFLYIYDRAQNTHLLINNPYQMTKLYYRCENSVLEFSSDLRTLIEKSKTTEPFFPSLNNFLSNGFNSSDKTQIKGIKKLLPSF